jgi:hypothetical protein
LLKDWRADSPPQAGGLPYNVQKEKSSFAGAALQIIDKRGEINLN